jgi:hypothetical protein
MNTFIKLIVIILFAYGAKLVMDFAGVDIGMYISYLLWFVSLGIFLILLPETLPTLIK